MADSQTGPIFRLRSDLQWIEYTTKNGATWVVRDPLTLEFYHFGDLERIFLVLLDGEKTLGQVIQKLQDRKINLPWAMQLLQRVESAGLLIRANDPVRGMRAWLMASRKSNRSLISRWLNPISIRLRLFDPSRFLDSLTWLSKVVFHKFVGWMVAGSILVVSCLVFIRLVGNGFQLMEPIGIAWNLQLGIQLMLTYAIIKSLHELGHALCCRYHGVGCHEIGVMFLMFIPCLYCDTSDSWRLKNRWQRASIAAAGIYIELIIALVASVLWLTTNSTSTLHLIAACAMVSASVSTVAVNANPLMRYDGYYVLSDISGVPNLALQSQSALSSIIQRIFIGVPIPKDAWDASPWYLAAYALSTKAYQTLMLGLIVTATWVMLDQAGVMLAGLLVLGMVLATTLFGLVGSLFRSAKLISGLSLWRRLRVVLVTTLVVGFLYWMIFAIHFPSWLSTRAVAELGELKPVYARESGELISCIDARKPVHQGDQLVVLRSFELEQELNQVEGMIASMKERVEQLKQSILIEDQAAFRLGETVEQLAKHLDRRAAILQQLSRLDVFAEAEGFFIHSSTQASAALSEAADKSAWRPVLDSSNIGCAIEKGTLLGWMAPSREFQLRAYVQQNDVEFIRPGMSVIIRFDGQPQQAYRGYLEEIVRQPIEATPDALVGDGVFISQVSPTGRFSPPTPHYDIRVRMEAQPSWLYHQALATVHISTEPTSLWQKLKRQFEVHLQPKFVNRNTRQ